MGDVRLVDLDIIKRYSLAVRQESAPAEDVLAALDASRELVAAALGTTAAATKPRARKTAAKSTKKAAS